MTKDQKAKVLCKYGHDAVHFGRDKHRRCKECCRQYARAKHHTDADRNKRYKKEFGIDLGQYNTLFAEQQGLCAGCYRHQTQLQRRLAVDHSHVTGEVRGLLCHECNLALGVLKDSKATLDRLSAYVERYDGRPKS